MSLRVIALAILFLIKICFKSTNVLDYNHFNKLCPDWQSEESSRYYTYSEFNNNVTNSGKNFRVIHYNIRSLLPKIDELRVELDVLGGCFDILCFTECWLDDTTSGMVSFDIYVPFHSLRKNKRGGGVSVFVHTANSVKLLTNFTFNYEFIETIFVEVTRGKFDILVGAIYRPPQGDCDFFLSKMDEILSLIRFNKYRNILISADFNYDLLRLKETRNLSFLSMMNSYSLLPMISKAYSYN